LDAGQAGFAGELQVDDGVARAEGFHSRQRLGEAGGAAHLVVLALEGALQRLGELGVVLDDDQPAFVAHRSASMASALKGAVTVTSAPPVSRLRASTRPPSLRITLNTRNRPRPPPSRPLVEL